MSLFSDSVLAVQRLFLGFEKAERSFTAKLDHEPIFIIGTPRSGSTLLFQLLTANFRLSYISNLMALFPVFMSRIAARTRQQILGQKDLKESDFGYVSGLHAPNEAGAIMRLWFEDSTADDFDKIRGSVMRVSTSTNAPLVFKNLNNSLRLKRILEVFPNARFIQIKRDPLFNSQSILMARKKLLADQKEWWSVAPVGFEKLLDKSPMEQVAWQISEIEKEVDSQLNGLPNRIVRIEYESLCRRPKETLRDIAQALSLEEKSKIDSSLDSLQISEKVKLSETEANELKQVLSKYF